MRKTSLSVTSNPVFEQRIKQRRKLLAVKRKLDNFLRTAKPKLPPAPAENPQAGEPETLPME